MKKLLLLFSIIITTTRITAQKDSISANGNEELKAKIEELKKSLEGLNESYLETKSTVDALKKIKVSGYIQMQMQSAEGDGAASFSGGNFGTGIHNRFGIRRGRLKAAYETDITNYVLQIDATEKSIGLKDAFILFKEPWLKTFGLKTGLFFRPFGFEINYSSSNREAPERSRMFQTLFPGERDLGASLEIFPIEGEAFSFLNFRGGFFAGNGINAETDNKKDFIGRLGFTFPFYEENLSIDGGVSIYAGGVKLASGKSIYNVDSSTSASVNTTDSYADRNYLGFDLQFYYELPVLGNFTLRGEYIRGKQPGGSAASSISPTSLQTDDLYLRNFYGYYINYIQNIGDKNRIVMKYDVYDPNSKVSGDEIGANEAAKLGAGDIKYSTLGIGLVHYWDKNIRLILYYDKVKNETTKNISGYESDLKDNVLTFRVQYKF
jgi:hypothetical protein